MKRHKKLIPILIIIILLIIMTGILKDGNVMAGSCYGSSCQGLDPHTTRCNRFTRIHLKNQIGSGREIGRASCRERV